MTLEVYGQQHKKRKHKNLHRALLIIGIFGLILFLLIYTSFYGEIPLKGNVVVGNIINLNSNIGLNSEKGGIRLDSELTVPLLEIDGEFEKLEIRGSSNSHIRIGGQKFYLGDIKNNYLVFHNYDGEISFNQGNILKFKGKSQEISVNGVFVTPQSGSTAKVELNDSFKYTFLKIEKEASVGELRYITSGTIMLNNKKEIFSVDNEEIIIKNFNGDLLIKDKKLYLDGYIKELEILGESSIRIKS